MVVLVEGVVSREALRGLKTIEGGGGQGDGGGGDGG